MVHIEINGLQANKLQEFWEKLDAILKSGHTMFVAGETSLVTAICPVFLKGSFPFLKLYYHFGGFPREDKEKAEQLARCIYSELNLPVHCIPMNNVL